MALHWPRWKMYREMIDFLQVCGQFHFFVIRISFTKLLTFGIEFFSTILSDDWFLLVFCSNVIVCFLLLISSNCKSNTKKKTINDNSVCLFN